MSEHGEGKDGNVDHEALKGFVDRLFNIEQSFADTKAEYTDDKKALKDEIKGQADETGVKAKQVEAMVKIRLSEVNALEEQAETNANMELYQMLYGFNADVSTADEDDEDALG